ncbi:hypothetical protein [Methanolobus sp.]|jgi:hypothetical protein|uniref:hypothetical protein n=1 Tax=Methanolobus sp. TaxID=1874737 RepID=UPI0025DFA3B3|nr:hypothetical protein [Methanolobus sp.]
MKRMPFVVLVFLMLLVVISGMVDSGDMQQHPDEREDRGDLLHKSPFTVRESPHEDEYLIDKFSRLSPLDETAFLEDNIHKSEDMVVRLDKVITGLKAEGNDINELEQTVNDYSRFVSEARTYLAQAENSSLEADKEQYLKLSRESIIRANSELKPIFDEIKSYLPGPLLISENSSLVARGSGISILSGDLDVDFFLSEGRFSIVDFSGDVQIKMEQDFESEEMPERGPDNGLMVPHEAFSYANVTGNVSVSGSEFTVAMMADNIILRTTGTGEAELIGEGVYYFDDGTVRNESNWVQPIFESG